MEQVCLKINNLSKIYDNDTKALDNVNLEIKKGEIFGLLGPNGAGKSTLINCLCGITKPTAGDAFVFDYSIINDILKVKQRIGIVPQEISFDGFFNVQEMLTFHSGYYGILKNTEQINYLLKKLSLYDKKKINTRHLSGGMKRRLLVAKALVHKPQFLILDEPTAGVDVELRYNLWQFIKELNNSGVTILLTTHYLNEAEQLCDRLAIINKGNIIETSTVEELKNRFDFKRKMYIYLKEKIEKIDERLNEFNPKIINKNKVIELSFKSTEYKKIIKLLNEANLDLIRFKTEEPDLEKVFINLVRQDNV